MLWLEVKPNVRAHDHRDNGILILDDMPTEKPSTDENEIMCWHYYHTKNHLIKGSNLLTCMVRHGDANLPVGYEVVKNDLNYSDLKTRKERRKASVTNNDLFRNSISRTISNQIKYQYVLNDNWFSSNDNMNFIHHYVGKLFIM